ncbi:MAG TPA: hypothetical protein VMT57_03685, partial [Candidatus Thermoplasmatota archaeon]|nr:hypothetical protein [Candidatus Thermoplasmatota archaeon]
MRNFMGDNRGISTVVGAIMLTLIVVTAATTYAIFLSDQQRKVQDAETQKLQRTLENLTVLSLENPTYNSPTLGSVSFVIANMNSQQAVITSMNINNRFIRQFTFERSDGSLEEWNQNSGEFQIGCLYAKNNATGDSYLFIDRNNNHKYDRGEEILNYDYDGNRMNAIPIVNDSGGLLAKNSTGHYFVFRDSDNSTKYDAGDSIIDLNPYNNATSTTPEVNNSGSRFFVDYIKRPTILP